MVSIELKEEFIYKLLSWMWPRHSRLSLCRRSDCSKQNPGLVRQVIVTSSPPIFQHPHWGGDLGQQRRAAQERALHKEICAQVYPADQTVMVTALMVVQPGKIQVKFISSFAIGELSLRWAAVCGLTAQSLGSNWAEYTGTNWFIWRNMGCQQQKSFLFWFFFVFHWNLVNYRMNQI